MQFILVEPAHAGGGSYEDDSDCGEAGGVLILLLIVGFIIALGSR